MPRVWFDNDTLSFLHSKKLLDLVAELLKGNGCLAATIQSVYRVEAIDAVRLALDALCRRGFFEVVSDPDKRTHPDKKWRKLRAKIETAAKSRRTTSQNDRQLLFHAEYESCPLVTGDGPLKNLALDRCHGPVYDLLDAVDWLAHKGKIDGERRKEILRSFPGHGNTVETLEQESAARSGGGRFSCAASNASESESDEGGDALTCRPGHDQ